MKSIFLNTDTVVNSKIRQTCANDIDNHYHLQQYSKSTLFIPTELNECSVIAPHLIKFISKQFEIAKGLLNRHKRV